MHRSIQRGALAGIFVAICVAACTAGNSAAPPQDDDTSSAGTAGAAATSGAVQSSGGAAAGVAGSVSSAGGTAGTGQVAGSGGSAPAAGTGGTISSAGTTAGGSTGTSGSAGAAGCSAPNTDCGGQCHDLTSDAANCSACGMSCAVGQMCSASACVCATGRTNCSGTCADTTSDPKNCGACGMACTASQVCSQGKCGTGCAAGLSKCGSACVDLTGSPVNCGVCGTVCPVDQSCLQSKCICAIGKDTCGANGACVDVTGSATNCGKCGTQCATGASCVASVCACPTGQTACNNVCVDMNTDGKNCGACGKTCGSGTSCLYGACIDPSSVACSGSQANKSCTKDANITLGEYWVNNNQWGAASATAGGQQCIWSNCQMGDLIGWGTSFNWAGAPSQVKTFASVVFGWQFGWKTNSMGQRLVTSLPLQISSTKAINCGWDFTVTPTGTITIDVSYDMFAHTQSNAGTNDNPSDEIMVWLYRANGAGPIGGIVASPSLDGTTWDLHKGTNNSWNVFSYVRQTNATTSVLNMMDFMHDLVSRGYISNTKYLSSVQAGTEVFTGQGTLQTNGFYCRVQ